MAKWRQTGIRYLNAALLPALLICCSCEKKPDPAAVYERARQAFRAGAIEDAKSQLEPLRKFWDKGPGRDAVRLRLLKVEVLQSQMELDEAALLLARTTPIDADLKVQHSILWADELYKLGRPAAASVVLDDAAREAARLKDRHPAVVVTARQALMQLRLGQLDRAEEMLRDSLRGAGELNDDYDAAIALINLSFCSMRRDRFEQAIRFAESAEDRGRKANALRWVGAAIGNQASAYSYLGMMERARKLREKAIAIQEGMKDRYLLQQSFGEMGTLYYRLENWRMAANYYRQAYDMARSMPGGGAGDISTWAGNLAQVYLRLSDLDEARTWNERARALKEAAGETASLSYQEVTAAEILASQDKLDEAAARIKQVLADPKADAGVRWSAHATLAKVLSRRKRFGEADQHFREALKLIDTERSTFGEAGRQISFLARLIGFDQDYVDALMDRGEGRAALLAAESSRARVLRERFRQRDQAPSASVQELQDASRRAGAVLLSYWMAPRRGWLWVVTPNDVRWFPLPGETELVALLDRHQEAVEHATADPLRADASAKLSHLLLDPALPLLGPSPKVIVVPDGPLNRVNLETLPVHGRYWIEDATVSVAPSLLAFAAEPARTHRGLLPLLAVGDAQQADPQYGRLKFAHQELQAVARQFPGAELLEGAKASPAGYLEAKPERFRIIHFAAHAEANGDTPLSSAIILSRDGERYRLRVSDVRVHPLQADLVTVSACRSAGARAYSGEGMVGFAWGFLQAGARAVVAGLWNVDDESTADLMARMYDQLASGQPVPAALRAAKLSLLHGREAWRTPFHWAPFQVYLR